MPSAAWRSHGWRQNCGPVAPWALRKKQHKGNWNSSRFSGAAASWPAANALDHLLQLLNDKRAELARRLHAPLQAHLNHYLQILFPSASIEVAEDLSPGRITRLGTSGAESGAFGELSLGAREQLGVVARLAYADLLKAAGRPTLLILDDALVNTDQARLGQMKRVLYDAASRHQILVLSCHPQAWQDLGVAARSLL